MNANTEQRGVVAKRRLPGDFHTPVPHTLQPWPLNHTADHAGDLGRIPAIGKAVTNPRARIGPRCPPTKNPFDRESLAWLKRSPTHAFLPTVTIKRPQWSPPPVVNGNAQVRFASAARAANGCATPGASAPDRSGRNDYFLVIKMLGLDPLGRQAPVQNSGEEDQLDIP